MPLSWLEHNVTCEHVDSELFDDFKEINLVVELFLCLSEEEIIAFRFSSEAATVWAREVSDEPKSRVAVREDGSV